MFIYKRCSTQDITKVPDKPLENVVKVCSITYNLFVIWIHIHWIDKLKLWAIVIEFTVRKWTAPSKWWVSPFCFSIYLMMMKMCGLSIDSSTVLRVTRSGWQDVKERAAKNKGVYGRYSS